VSVGEPSSGGGATSTGPGKHSLPGAENPQPQVKPNNQEKQ
jgi:hypothetical protein